MAIDYGAEKYQGNTVFLPKIGEEATFEIETISEVKGENPKFNFSQDVPVLVNGQQVIDDEGKVVTKKKDLGYHIEAKLTSGKVLSVNSMAAFFKVFKAHKIGDGEKVFIKHVAKGEWVITKL